MNEPKPYIEKEPEVSTFNELDLCAEYSYANYLRFKFEERVEIIKGKLHPMTPAPAPLHQAVLGNIHAPMHQFLRHKPCKVFVAPFDVRFPIGSKTDKNIFTVLQPDICVICDPQKLDDKGCLGAPDLVVEILSPENNQKELVRKYQVYEEHGVREYWVASPSEQTLLIYTLQQNGKFQAGKLLTAGEVAKSGLINGFELNLDEVFDN